MAHPTRNPRDAAANTGRPQTDTHLPARGAGARGGVGNSRPDGVAPSEGPRRAGPSRDGSIVLLFCPLGFLTAILAHMILVGVAVALAVIYRNPIYWGSALGYALLTGLLVMKFIQQRRAARRRRR